MLRELFRQLSFYSDVEVTKENFSLNTRTIVFFPFFKVSREEQMQLENLLLGLKSFVKEEFMAFVPLTHPTMAALHEFPTLMEIFDYFYTNVIDDLLKCEACKYGS